MALDPDREIFPNPFVRIVHAFVGFAETLGSRWHNLVLSSVIEHGFEVVLPTLTEERDDAELFRATKAADLIALYPDSISITTADYERWERFHSVVQLAVESAASNRLIEYMSLNILDEIRPRTTTRADQWDAYTRLPVSTSGLDLGVIGNSYGGLIIHLDSNHHVRVEWTHTSESALYEEHPLFHFYKSPESPLLAVNWDGSCSPDESCSAEVAMEIFDGLHDSIKKSFMKVMTRKSFDLMRGKI